MLHPRLILQTLQALWADESQRPALLNTLAYYLAYIRLGSWVGMIGPALPTIADNVDVSVDTISNLFIVSIFGYGLGVFLAGWSYDRFAGHRIKSVGVLGMVGGIFIYPLIRSYEVLVLVHFIFAATTALVDIGGNTLIVWNHGDKVDPYMNGLHFFFGLGAFVAPLVFAQALELTGSIVPVFWIFALFLVPVALWLLRLPSPSHPPKAQTEADKHLGNTGLLALLAAFFAVYVAVEISMGNWIYYYATEKNLADEISAAYLTSAFWGSFTLFRLIGVGIAMRVSPYYVLRADLIICLLAVSIGVLWPHSLVAIATSTMLLGAGIASIFASTLAFAQKYMLITGRVSSLLFMGVNFSGVVPWGFGQYFGRYGVDNFFPGLLTGTLLLLILFICFSAFARRMPSPLMERESTLAPQAASD